MKCRDRAYYKETDAQLGSYYGVKIKGDRDPSKDSDKCKGKHFKLRISKK